MMKRLAVETGWAGLEMMIVAGMSVGGASSASPVIFPYNGLGGTVTDPARIGASATPP